MSSGDQLDRRALTYGALHGPSKGPSDLADVLERVLDKGIVIAGDIQINLLDIELRLLVASVERAREMGIDWWESDPALSSSAKQLEAENRELRARLERIEQAAGLPPAESERKVSRSGDAEGGATAYAEAKGEDAEVWTSVDDEEESGRDAEQR
jgi:hypothetical protein